MLKDADIREPLFDFLDELYGKNRIIEEKTIGKSRADVVMVTESAIYGLEIKSDADTYARLARQIKDYDKYYDYNYVVVGTTHASHIKEHVPEYWGIITVEEIEGGIDFYVYRTPEKNPKIKLKMQIKIMWRPELMVIQLKNGMPKYKAKSKDFVINKILERVSYEEKNLKRIDENMLKKQMCELLLERDYNDIGASLREYMENENEEECRKKGKSNKNRLGRK